MSTTSVPVFFDERMVAAGHASFSPSARKPAQVVASWRALAERERLALTWHTPTPATRAELARAHDAALVDDVLACTRPNGFGDRSPEVAASLPWTTGAMLSATRHVLATGAPVAAAPCSGFHHASWSSPGGFCTFNGLVVTALCAREGARVGIVDCDAHYGDGTDAILDVLAPDERARIVHWTAGAAYGWRAQVPAFFDELPRVLETMRGCDVVLYQAGADPHVDDPLGGLLTTDELLRRDTIVFEAFAAMDVPVVWNLAGGYQREPDGGIPKVLEIHDNTMRACARVHGALRPGAALSTPC